MNQSLHPNHAFLKTGYLHDDVKFFHIKDRPGRRFSAHYHSFHKLLILLQGNLLYSIEGHRYEPDLGDILLVPAGEIHHPEIDDTCEYERIIFYISDDFLEQYEKQGYQVRRPFTHADETGRHLIRFDEETKAVLTHICTELVGSMGGPDPAMMALYQKIKLLELLILITQGAAGDQRAQYQSAIRNPNIQRTLEYIHQHLSEEALSINEICNAVFLNRSYLMHLFKDQTGYSMGQYIAEKRLLLADSLIKEGYNTTEACMRSGFKNYAAYYHAKKSRKMV